jgi:Kef-type K+ transport system membrane component KefB
MNARRRFDSWDCLFALAVFIAATGVVEFCLGCYRLRPWLGEMAFGLSIGAIGIFVAVLALRGGRKG